MKWLIFLILLFIKDELNIGSWPGNEARGQECYRRVEEECFVFQLATVFEASCKYGWPEVIFRR